MSPQFINIDQRLTFATENVQSKQMLVFDGNDWVHSFKSNWQEFAPNLYYDRAISLGRSNHYLGRLTVQDPDQQRVQFLNQSQTRGLSFLVQGIKICHLIFCLDLTFLRHKHLSDLILQVLVMG